ncbi:phosphatase [Clostridium sp. W14A]|nr:phosphatase [Clostridium sp. W14A]
MKALFDLHTHTLASGHAFSTLRENIESARQKGLLAVGTSDHAEKMPGANPALFSNYKVVRESFEGVRVFCGIEANICDFEGIIDVDDSLLQKLDYVIASLHSPCIQSGSIRQNTNALIRAMENPSVKIIGHPDDSRYPLDYGALVSAAKKRGTALELNNSSLIPGSTRVGARANAKKLLEACKRNRASVVIGSDAHIWYDVGRFEEAFALINEVGFPEELVLNLSFDGLKMILNSKSHRILPAF